MLLEFVFFLFSTTILIMYCVRWFFFLIDIFDVFDFGDWIDFCLFLCFFLFNFFFIFVICIFGESNFESLVRNIFGICKFILLVCSIMFLVLIKIIVGCCKNKYLE